MFGVGFVSVPIVTILGRHVKPHGTNIHASKSMPLFSKIGFVEC